MTVISGKRPRIFWYEVGQKWAIRTPPLPDPLKTKLFVTGLRQTCGAVFHQQAQVWTVPAKNLDKAKELVAKYYTHYEFIEKVATPPPAPPSFLHPESYETFCTLVGWKRGTLPTRAEAKVLYRQAAARLHPDVGGSADRMASLNDAWRAIKDKLS